MPAATSVVEPVHSPDCASYVSTRTGRIVTLGATPQSVEPMVPATWVPWPHLSGRPMPGVHVVPARPTQLAPAAIRPLNSGCFVSTQVSTTATFTPAPDLPAACTDGVILAW